MILRRVRGRLFVVAVPLQVLMLQLPDLTPSHFSRTISVLLEAYVDIRSRLNLDFLQQLSLRYTLRKANTGLPYLTRRHFLTLSASGATLGAIPPSLLGAGFRVVQRGEAVHVLVGEQSRWTIDPAAFGTQARVTIARTDGGVTINLRRAFFAGTTLAADLQCVFHPSLGTWIVEISLKNGFEVRAEALPWLLGSEQAVGEMAATRLNPFGGFSLHLLRSAKVALSPDWELSIVGPHVGSSRRHRSRLNSDRCLIWPFCTLSELAAEAGASATSFLIGAETLRGQ